MASPSSWSWCCNPSVCWLDGEGINDFDFTSKGLLTDPDDSRILFFFQPCLISFQTVVPGYAEPVT